jgi:hypothetical protein
MECSTPVAASKVISDRSVCGSPSATKIYFSHGTHHNLGVAFGPVFASDLEVCLVCRIACKLFELAQMSVSARVL